MPKFRKKPVVIDAHQWFKNGDHPEDGCRWMEPEPGADLQFEPHYVGEGAVVRFYRRPDVDGARPCEHCGLGMDAHGWIDTLEAGHNVCPGDWIITGVQGERYPCKPDIFELTYGPDAPVDVDDSVRAIMDHVEAYGTPAREFIEKILNEVASMQPVTVGVDMASGKDHTVQSVLQDGKVIASSVVAPGTGLDAVVKCPECDGSGTVRLTEVDCPRCEGTGKV